MYKKSVFHEIYCTLLLIFLLMVGMTIVYVMIMGKDEDMMQKAMQQNTLKDTFFNYFIEYNHLKKNCDLQEVYALTDFDCSNICMPTGVFTSRYGMCVNTNHFNENALAPHLEKCIQKNGMMTYIIGNGQFGTLSQQCLSIDPGIKSDDPNERNGICLNTDTLADINYVERFPTYKDCACKEPNVLKILPATATMRPRGFCIHRDMSNFYDDPDIERTLLKDTKYVIVDDSRRSSDV